MTTHGPQSNGDFSAATNDGDHAAAPDNPREDILDAYSRAVMNVAETAGPSVIGITGSPQPGRSRRRRQAGRGGPRGHRNPGGGSGSGFLISGDGLAVTNSHVVRGQRHFVARTVDGDRIDAELVGDDPSTDLAVIRLATRGLTHLEFGDVAPARPGQLAIALGSPLGLHSTVSAGIVSAIGRTLRGQDGRLIDDVLQHTAPINPGNSGGPLLDSRGHVIGINTAIIPMAQGIGFAVSATTAARVIGDLLTHGRVQRRHLGIAAATVRVPRDIARKTDVLNTTAVEVIGVDGEGPAALHLANGDVITAINGRIIEQVDDVHRQLSKLDANSPVNLEVIRDGVRRLINLPATRADS